MKEDFQTGEMKRKRRSGETSWTVKEQLGNKLTPPGSTVRRLQLRNTADDNANIYISC